MKKLSKWWEVFENSWKISQKMSFEKKENMFDKFHIISTMEAEITHN